MKRVSRRLSGVLVFVIMALPGNAQNTLSMPSGEYYLQGVQDMASGFRINDDHSFDFFFIYGAVDRFGKGAWTLEGDHLMLNSPPKPSPDFLLQKSAPGDSTGTVIQITDPNRDILGYVMCQIETEDGEILRAESNSEGTIYFESNKPLHKIYLLHRLWPNEPFAAEVSQQGDRYFEFTISPTIMEVAVTQLELRVDAEGLHGGHPLMQPGREYFYRRAKH